MELPAGNETNLRSVSSREKALCELLLVSVAWPGLAPWCCSSSLGM